MASPEKDTRRSLAPPPAEGNRQASLSHPRSQRSASRSKSKAPTSAPEGTPKLSKGQKRRANEKLKKAALTKAATPSPAPEAKGKSERREPPRAVSPPAKRTKFDGDEAEAPGPPVPLTPQDWDRLAAEQAGTTHPLDRPRGRPASPRKSPGKTDPRQSRSRSSNARGRGTRGGGKPNKGRGKGQKGKKGRDDQKARGGQQDHRQQATRQEADTRQRNVSFESRKDANTGGDRGKKK